MNKIILGITVGIALAYSAIHVYKYIAPERYCYRTGGHLLAFNEEDHSIACIYRYKTHQEAP